MISAWIFGAVSGEGFGMPRVSPFVVGMANLHSWELLVVIVFAIWTGYGRRGGGAAEGG